MSWSLTNTSGTTAGTSGATGADGSTIVVFSDSFDTHPFTFGAVVAQEAFFQLAINTATFRLWSLPKNQNPAVLSNWTDEGSFAGLNGVAGDGYSGASYDSSTGQITFTGTGGNTDVVTGDLRGADGTSSAYLTGTGAPASGLGVNSDVYIDTDSGDLYQKSGGAWTTNLNINGSDGKDVASATTASGDLVITLSDASTINAGSVVGLDGGTPAFSIGTITTGVAGSSASVSVDGASTPLNQILNFTIPRGADGQAGANGLDGTTITRTEVVTKDSGGVGDLFVDDTKGVLYQKREVPHIHTINISLADYTGDDSTLNPNGDYKFTGFLETSDGDNYAQYELDNNDGTPTPDYVILYDEVEKEWELKSNTSPMPPPLAQCKIQEADGVCDYYPLMSRWDVARGNYPNSTLGTINPTESTDEFIEAELRGVTQVGSFVNEGSKASLAIPQKIGYANNIPYFGASHTTDGVLMTGATHTTSSMNILDVTTSTEDFKLNKVKISVSGACEILIYTKTSDNIVVTDDESIGGLGDYLGVYTKQSTNISGHSAYTNGNNKWITWDGDSWDFRDTSTGVSVRLITNQDVADPSTLTLTEANLINIYPERKNLKIGAFTDSTGNTGTATGYDDKISFINSFTGVIDLSELKDELGYPNVYFQLLSKNPVRLLVETIEYYNRKACWTKLVDVANPAGLTLGGLTNVSVNADYPLYDGTIIAWNKDNSEWALSNFTGTSWDGGDGDPASTTGLEGDFYFNFLTKDILRKEGGNWVTKLNTASGADGVGIASIEENDGSEVGKPAFSLTLTLDNDTEFTTSSLIGASGSNGSAGGLPIGGGGTIGGTGGGSAPWTPSQVQSEFWLDASRLSTITSGASGILVWADAFAQGINLVNESTSAYPQLSSYTGVDASFVAKNVPTIDGVTQLLSSSANLASVDTEFNLFGVFQIDDLTDGVILDIGDGSTTGSIKLFMESNKLRLDTRSKTNQLQNHVLIDAGSISVGDVITFGINARGVDYTIRLNGATIGVPVTNDITGALNTKDLSIGDPASTASVLAKHCEWILGKAHITDKEVLSKEGYLASRWGIATNLPTGHEYKSIAPSVTGGSQGQVLQKLSSADYDVAWVDPIPYNRYTTTGQKAIVDVEITSHGATILVDDKTQVVDLVLPYDPSNGWQCHFISRNDGYPIRILAKDSGGNTTTIVPDAGWGINNDLSTAPYLKNQGDSATATWDATRNKWYIIGNVRTFNEAFNIDSTTIQSGII